MTRARAIIIFIAVALCVGAALWHQGASASVHVVHRTERGFEPSRIIIHKGDSVIFTSDEIEFWPASDSHPTHGIYPEFDPGRSLEKGEKWTFKFEKAGAWQFHDHLQSQMKGTVLVVGDQQSLAECLKNVGGTTRSQCWAADLAALLSTNGLEAAFKEVQTLYTADPEFRKSCHDVMHLVGAAAYDEFVHNGIVIDSPGVSYCGFGFFHGFIETMLLAEGPRAYADVVSYCQTLGKQTGGAIGACYHGIGHAVLDMMESEIWGDGEAMAKRGVDTCERILTGEYEQVRCASGVYNALSIAYGSKLYKLAFPMAGPIPVCAKQAPQYQAFCFMEMGNAFIRDHPWNREQSLAFIRQVPDQKARAAVMRGYADTDVKRTIDSVDLSGLAQMCSLQKEQTIAEGCVQGILTGLLVSGEPGKEYALISTFCNAITKKTLRDFCTRSSTDGSL